MLLAVFSRHAGKSSPTLNPSSVGTDGLDNEKGNGVAQNSAIPSNESVLKKEPIPKPPVPSQEVPPSDEGAFEVHRKMADDLNAKSREATRELYAGAFRQLHLPANLQEKVIDILTKEQTQVEQQAFQAAQSGTLPALPSLAEARAQQTEQDQQLRGLLGDAGFAQFNQYRATIPDRSMIDAMNQQGANLSESQTQQLLQILTDARQQIIAQAGITRNLDSMPPEQAIAVVQEQQVLLQQTVGNRVQNIVTPDQARTLQEALSGFNINPRAR
jgi:hypothetical protein